MSSERAFPSSSFCVSDHSDVPSNAVTLSPESVEAVAVRVAELLSGVEPARKFVDAQTAADALGVSRRTVYEHAPELGGVRVGGAWRFDLAAIRCSAGNRSQVTVDAEKSSRRGAKRAPATRAKRVGGARLPIGLPVTGHVLPIRGRL